MVINMENQSKLLEMLQEIKAIAASQQNKLTKEEVRKYLGDENLSEDKLQAVYQYLGENNITVEGYEFVPVAEKVNKKKAVQETNKKSAKASYDRARAEKSSTVKKASEKTGAVKESRRDVNMKLYRQEIAQYGGKLEEEQILGFLNGDDSLKNTIIENYLQQVVKLAGKYQKRNVPIDEIIAEGNVGLLVAMQIIEQNREEYILSEGSLDTEKFYGTLDMEISHAMELYIDDMTASKDWENAMLAKTNLLHEATKYMAEEIGRVPTIEELSEYTKISRDEINDIMGLSVDAKRVASVE